MRTLLSRFCEEFEGVVRPLLRPLQRSTESLAAATPGLPARQILPGLHDTRHGLEALAEKVAGQQAYVLIFGPLKSGKSTLMNAMSAAYVSEVTCLPAYPCMVYVSHSDSRELKATRYDGATSTFSDSAALRLGLAHAHGELAQRIRAVEGQGEPFDPGIHFPEAIRRVDVKVPAGQLASSGAVLVDTPGLYTRMKFGYDRMTREFRDAAACAVFVVKTDNLFLEQVFDEFNRLLELFGRIFLVVNLDTTKKDLRPDGSLAPSLEREDPVRIIEAFESLSMDGPLRAALDEGRLRIYPVDLLRAASRRIKAGQEGRKPLHVPGDEDEGGTKQADFDAFLTDLTDYLNSTDYLVAFLGDSLRHARSLLDDAGALCSTDAVHALALEVDALKADRENARATLSRAKRAEAFDWRASFADLRARCFASTRERAAEIEERAGHAVAGLLDRWFEGGDSLAHLLVAHAKALATAFRDELSPAVTRGLRDRAGDGAAGASATADVREALGSLGISLDVLARSALDGLGDTESIPVPAPTVSLDDVPVRKRFWDWVFFRSRAKVRRRLFGSAERPSKPIPRAAKAKRLGAPARAAIRAMLGAHLEREMPRAFERLVERRVADYAEAATRAILAEVGGRRTECEGRLADVEARLAETGRVREDLAALETAVAAAEESIADLTRRYGETDPSRLKEPVPEAPPAALPTGEPESIRTTEESAAA